MPVTVTSAPGQKVEGTLVRIDDFYVVVELADGTQRTFRRDGEHPVVEFAIRWSHTASCCRPTPTRTFTT